ncbi:hypothetical protein BO85DRAFT_8942 [Aspergillus piperis CBS 112811]|uniref:Uncharacterized protein n=1 Tax=Aspergillus piperis CBS 112811 TaxID=1448313 RepID=A0A8G1RE92_9EURO|nr:hypothetical protein BO85DRAFT_8942 [Aspergillus piperis CBS 112811]RAH62820.1 hypothetical protein BO85DRAFT_8942 [Aspergillus piperis CBS 112811]
MPQATLTTNQSTACVPRGCDSKVSLNQESAGPRIQLTLSETEDGVDICQLHGLTGSWWNNGTTRTFRERLTRLLRPVMTSAYEAQSRLWCFYESSLILVAGIS